MALTDSQQFRATESPQVGGVIDIIVDPSVSQRDANMTFRNPGFPSTIPLHSASPAGGGCSEGIDATATAHYLPSPIPKKSQNSEVVTGQYIAVPDVVELEGDLPEDTTEIHGHRAPAALLVEGGQQQRFSAKPHTGDFAMTIRKHHQLIPRHRPTTESRNPAVVAALLRPVRMAKFKDE